METTAESTARPVPGPSYFQSYGYFKRAMKFGFIQMLEELNAKYGDWAKLQTPNRQTMYVVNDPAAIHEILQTQSKKFIKGKSVEPFKMLVGNSLPVSDGNEWTQQRRVLQPSFHRSRMHNYVPQILATTEKFIEDWKKQGETNITSEAGRLTHDIVAKSFFGADLGDIHVLQNAWEVALTFIYSELQNIVKIPLSIPTPRNQKFKKALATVNATVDEIIQTRVAQAAQGNAPGDDLLSRLIASRKTEGEAVLDDRQIRDQTLAFLFAGHETTASNVAWTLYLLLANPACLEKLLTEIDSVPLTTDGLKPESLATMNYLKSVIFESMRLYPPAALFVREAIEDTVVTGYPIKKGGIIFISPYLFHRRAELWPDPLKFDPERFVDGMSPRHGSPKFIAFGYGPRACIGEQFAIIEAQIILIAILQRLKLQLVSIEKPSLVFTGTMGPSPIQVKVSERHK